MQTGLPHSSDGPGVLAFYLAIAAMIGIALAFVLPRLSGGIGATRGASRDALNADIYRAQIEDLERERDAGALTDAEYRSGRAELERRLLEDVAAKRAPDAQRRAPRAMVAIGILFPALAVGLYAAFGTPAAIRLDGAPGTTQPLAGAELRGQLAAHLASAPRDGRAWVALARLDMSEDRFGEAAAHYAQGLAASDKIARDPGVLCEYADALGMAQGGRLEGRPSEIVARALALDPAHPRALEMAGSAAYERRDYRTAARHWRDLLARLEAGTPEHAELGAAVERADRLASVTLPSDAGTRRPAGAP